MSTERIGGYLKREREARGLTLDDVAQRTRIQRGYLEAIERDDLKSLPSGPFIKGFVSTYAKLLGLKADQVVAMLPDSDESPLLNPPAVEGARKVGRLQIRELPAGGERPAGWVVWVLVVVVVAIGLGGVAWFSPSVRARLGLGQTPGPVAQVPVPKVAKPAVQNPAEGVSSTKGGAAKEKKAGQLKAGEDKASATSQAALEASPSVLPGATASLPQAPTPVAKTGPAVTEPGGGVTPGGQASSAGAGVQRLAPIVSEEERQEYLVFTDMGHKPGQAQLVRITAEKKTYLRISPALSSPPSWEGILQVGESKDFSSRDDLWIIVGNAAGVKVEYNGNPLGSLGKLGERKGLAFRASPR